MNSKEIKTRLSLKTDYTNNWNNTENFIPLFGEACVYIDGKKINTEEGTTTEHYIPKIKIGDGVTNIKTLPFIDDLSTLNYAECPTAADSPLKTATVATNFMLEKGVQITVKFSSENKTGTPTLSINGTEAKELRWKDKSLSFWPSNSIFNFIYDGSYWQLIGAINPIQNTRYYLGAMPKKTITGLKESLDEWLNKASNYIGASAYFVASANWITYWNEENTTNEIAGGPYWTATIRSYNSSENYTLLEINSYANKGSWYLAKVNNNWGKVNHVAFIEDLQNYTEDFQSSIEELQSSIEDLQNRVIDGGTWS